MAYLGKDPKNVGVRQRYQYVASASDTSVSGADANGKTLSFTDGQYVDVFLNGVLLKANTDYAYGTNAITDMSALSANDEIEVIVYDVFSFRDTQSQNIRVRHYVTASGGETSISGNDDDGRPIAFSSGAQIDVKLNGITLVAGSDYNTNTANTVGGLSALSANDIVEICVYDKYTTFDTIAASGGTFGGAVTHNATVALNEGATLPDDKHLVYANYPYVELQGDDTTSYTTFTNSGDAIIWPSVRYGDSSLYNTTTGVFTAPVKGLYLWSGIMLQNSPTAARSFGFFIGASSATYEYISFNQNTGSTGQISNRGLLVNTMIPLDANEPCKMVVALGPIDVYQRRPATTVQHYSHLSITLIAARS